MGLPVWRAPSPEAPAHSLKADPTAPARSPIRRRRPARSPRSPRQRDRDVQTSFTSTTTRPRPYPPAPPAPLPARNPSRRSADTPGPNHEDESSSAPSSYFRLTTDVPRGLLMPQQEPRRTLPALTPNFAPAMRADLRPNRSIMRQRERSGPLRTSMHVASDAQAPLDADEDSSDNAVGFPPLRRMGRRTIADGPLPSSSLRESWSPATTLDGLGDRERSMSPVVDDHWETMLTSVAPDPLPPTTDSSFTSAAASASFSNSHPSSRAGSSNSNSATSSRTHLTVPSRRQSWSFDDQFIRACDTSEDESASDTEAEDLALNHDALAPRGLLSGARTVSRDPPPRDPYRISRAVRQRSHESSAYVRSFYGEAPFEHARRVEEQLAAEERANTDEEMPLDDQELRDARALLERLTRREDISDDFWASVGLRRPVADRVERFQQRQRM